MSSLSNVIPITYFNSILYREDHIGEYLSEMVLLSAETSNSYNEMLMWTPREVKSIFKYIEKYLEKKYSSK